MDYSERIKPQIEAARARGNISAFELGRFGSIVTEYALDPRVTILYFLGTGHIVINLNAEDGEERMFLVDLDSPEGLVKVESGSLQ